jgi:hypothetical protein
LSPNFTFTSLLHPIVPPTNISHCRAGVHSSLRLDQPAMSAGCLGLWYLISVILDRPTVAVSADWRRVVLLLLEKRLPGSFCSSWSSSFAPCGVCFRPMSTVWCFPDTYRGSVLFPLVLV